MKTIFQKLTMAAGLALLLLTSGCFDTADEFTINPDGSGKVVHECTFQSLNLGGETQDPDQILTNAVKEVLGNTQGVDAWRDVTFKTLDDGRLYFRGTAYFKNLSKLDLQNQTMLEFDWTAMADGHGLLTVRTNKSTSPSGNPAIHPKHEPAKILTPEQLAKQIKRQRAEFQRSKPFLTGIIGAMKHSVVLHLPGKVQLRSNFATDGAGNLTIRFDGAKLLEVMEKLVNDDDWCRKHLGTGMDQMQDTPLMMEEVNQYMFGEKAPVSATIVIAAAPLFDYAKEMAMAKNEYARTQKELHIGSPAAAEEAPEAAVSASPAKGGLKSVKVAGVRLVRESDQQRELRPFNYDAGYTISLLVEFPGAIQSVANDNQLDTATADDNTSLLPASEWDRKVQFPQIAKDKTAAILEYKLNLPGSGVKSLKEISGQVHYLVSSGTKEVDLGLAELKAGATGTNLDARIQSISDGWQKNGSQIMALHLQTEPQNLKSLSLVVDGNKTVLRQNSFGGGNGSYDFSYEYKQAFPANGRLVAELYDKIQKFDAPFKLENLTLDGASGAAAK